jgi:actin-related protein
MSLSMGGDDITEFLYVLLRRIKFPYRDMDLNRSYDWNVMEDLKSRLCTLADVCVSDLFRRLCLNAVLGRCCFESLRFHCTAAK